MSTSSAITPAVSFTNPGFGTTAFHSAAFLGGHAPAPSDNACDRLCLDECGGPFNRLRIRPSIRFGTWVEWLLDPEFGDAGSYLYELQVGHTANPQADDWAVVGLPAADAAYLIDDEPRVFGQTQWTHYRVKLTTDAGVYYSKPTLAIGSLPLRFWRLVVNRERQWLQQMTQTHRGQRGYLLKRRLTGARPTPGDGVVDYLTDEVVNPQAVETVGTEFIGGYYAPIGCIYAAIEPGERYEQVENSGSRGSVNSGADKSVPATMLATPQIDSRDVWVSANSDFRYEIHGIKDAEAIQGVPVVVTAEFRLLPFTHPAYGFQIEGHPV